MAAQLEAELDRLFGLPLSEFTAARNELAKELRDAGRRDEQRALERLAGAAREVAVREGSGQAAVAQATQTLRAASLTDDGRELLKRGRLTEELEPPGFEALTGL